MSESKHFDKIALAVTALVLIITILFMNGGALGLKAKENKMGYEDLLFDNTKVHTIDIIMDDWDGFIGNTTSELYYPSAVVIDGEVCKHVAIRGKGHASLSMVSVLDSERYSLKLEFDHYDDSITYHGLDKLNLNNLIQDATMMKDYLTYELMRAFGIAAPLCSFVYITVNGEDWGLYLAVEDMEESFLKRNYGVGYGKLYRPYIMDNTKSADAKLQYIDDRISSYPNIWLNAKLDIAKPDQYRLIESLKKLSNGEDLESVVDIEQVIRFFVVHNYVCNGDSYTGALAHNYYLYEDNGQLTMLPWDYNLAFGTFLGGYAQFIINMPIDNPVTGGASAERPMWNWILENESYTEQYHRYFAEFLDTADFDGIIDSTYQLVKPYVEKDPTAFYSYEEFEDGVAALRKFCQLRSESIYKQLETGETMKIMNYADASGLKLSDMGNMSVDRER
ncbi:MAG: spore coat protein CotH [Ruminococcaceae bacterium]|nr:spore coat protein CotH [Oscillospiraceae bacterium]